MHEPDASLPNKRTNQRRLRRRELKVLLLRELERELELLLLDECETCVLFNIEAT